MNNNIRNILKVLIILTGGIILGFIFDTGSSHNHETPSAESPSEYTCSMHPEIRMPEPGLCPICNMDLIPVSSGSGGSAGPGEIELSESAKAAAEVLTAEVKRSFEPVEIRMAGKITYDDTRLYYTAARFPGRIERMFVNYTGIPVNKGDHLFEMYSPELITAQQEFLQARRNGGGNTLQAAEEKLRLWGITAPQIDSLKKRKTPERTTTVFAGHSGIVIAKHVEEGAYVKEGTRIYTIADLSRLWVLLDAYESDIALLSYGQPVEISTEAYPGESFSGMISFISPVLDDTTRTVKVRVTVDNSKGRLKPAMFVRGLVRATVSEQGTVVENSLTGKWISPMHPEVIKDGPGACDVCGMDLVPAEKLGVAPSEEGQTAPLIIPASAPLITGKRAVVYVQDPSRTEVFAQREVVLGHRTGNYYIVKSGLKEGEKVVYSGNFKIDSALQIQGKPSMMNPKGGPAGGAHNHHGHTPADTMKPAPQSLCPVMNNPINKKEFVDYKGKRIYFCCSGCDDLFLENPDKYLEEMKTAGVILEDTPPDNKGEHDEHSH